VRPKIDETKHSSEGSSKEKQKEHPMKSMEEVWRIAAICDGKELWKCEAWSEK